MRKSTKPDDHLTVRTIPHAGTRVHYASGRAQYLGNPAAAGRASSRTAREGEEEEEEEERSDARGS